MIQNLPQNSLIWGLLTSQIYLDIDSFQWRFYNSYRVGRTARGNNKGTALSLVAAKEKDRADEVDQALSGQEPTTGDATGGTSIFKPYKFRMEELDGFRYRAQDAWRSVTRVAIREARWDMTFKLELLCFQLLSYCWLSEF